MMRTHPSAPGTAEREFTDAVALLARATRAEDLFGPVPTDGNLDQARWTYRYLATLVHPDKATPCQQDTATAAFATLSRLWQTFTRAAASSGTAGTAGAGAGVVRITTRRHSVTVGALLARGDVANVYTADALPTADDGGPHATGPAAPGQAAVLKLARHPRDNDLLATEAAALTRIAEKGAARFAAYTPDLLETFVHRDRGTGIDRRANLIARLDGFVTLTDVAAAYPGGLDARDAAWMWRRLLVALGAVHRAGVIHGAVVPEHVLIHPELHGLVLVDYTFAVLDQGGHVPAIVPHRRELYPPEVPARQPATAATDIYLATRTIAALMGARAPAPLRAFVSGCTQATPSMRPQDAWALKDELDELLERLYGPRRFRPFHMPAPPTR